MIRLAVRCRPDQAELVLAELLALAPGGVEESSGEDWVEYAIYGAEGELPELGRLEAIAEPKAELGPGSAERAIQVSSERIADDWGERWRDFHRPAIVAERVMIRPPWTDPAPQGLIDLVIDPGQAFGTGAHPTTRLCVELLLELADRAEGADEAPGSLADLGTGSGVLAIAAAKLGFGPIAAVDHERAAVAAAGQNAAANGVGFELAELDLREAAPPAALNVTANLMALLLRELAEPLAAIGPDRLILSGLLTHELDEISTLYSKTIGTVERDRRVLGDWGALLLERSH